LPIAECRLPIETKKDSGLRTPDIVPMDAATLDTLPHPAGYADAADLSTPWAPDSVLIPQSSALPAGGRCPMGFGLFILVNATLFIRPAEIVSGWEGVPIYQILILGCLLASLPVVLPQLTWESLRRNPITLCVIGLLVAVILSHLSHGDLYSARMGAAEFGKVLIYYLLLVGLVDSPARLRLFLLITAGFILCTAILSLLNHHGFIDISSLKDLQQFEGVDTAADPDGDPTYTVRLRAMGIFNDPNDFCLILNVAIFICLHWILENKSWLLKVAWVLPIGILTYALILTQSRGGFLSLLAGLLVLMFTRVSRKRAILICAVLFPAMLVAFGGRLTNIDVENSNDSAQGRILLWRDSIVEFHGSPVFGIGQGNLPDAIGLVAHNSYIHCYAELGFFGGTLFLGAFFLAVTGVRGLATVETSEFADDLQWLRRCLIPILAAYMAGIYSLSRPYGNATYLVLGIAAAFLSFAIPAVANIPQFGIRQLRILVAVSVACILYFEVFIRALAR
jgi:hypothetical protein